MTAKKTTARKRATAQKEAKAVAHVKRHPAEYGAAGVWAALVALLEAFHVDPAVSLAIAGMAAALAPGVLTWLRNRGYI